MSGGQSYLGSCYCGAVRFRVRLRELPARDCNGSVCFRRGLSHLIVRPGDFELLIGEDFLVTYTFNTAVAEHRFCRRCGIRPFYRPRSHPDQTSVNARCLESLALDRLAIGEFDGRNWEESASRLRATTGR